MVPARKRPGDIAELGGGPSCSSSADRHQQGRATSTRCIRRGRGIRRPIRARSERVVGRGVEGISREAARTLRVGLVATTEVDQGRRRPTAPGTSTVGSEPAPPCSRACPCSCTEESSTGRATAGGSPARAEGCAVCGGENSKAHVCASIDDQGRQSRDRDLTLHDARANSGVSTCPVCGGPPPENGCRARPRKIHDIELRAR